MGLQYRFWYGSNNLRDVLRLRGAIAKQTEEITVLTHRNQILEAEVLAIKANPAALEDRARTEHGMIKPGETFCLVVGP